MEIRMSVDTKGSAKTALTDALTPILTLCNLQELRGNAERKDGEGPSPNYSDCFRHLGQNGSLKKEINL